MRTILKSLIRPSAIMALAALAACQAADGSNQSPENALIGGLMAGLGAVDPNEKPIEYKPRAPLAMPTKAASLPEPETKVAGTNSEAWPETKENPEFARIKEIYANENNSGALTPEQARGFKIGNSAPRLRDYEAERRRQEIVEGDTLTVEELAASSKRAAELEDELRGQKNAYVATRRYLVEPPTEYSTPAPNAPVPQSAEEIKAAEKAKECQLNPDSFKCWFRRD